jgi:hypothetical protein
VIREAHLVPSTAVSPPSAHPASLEGDKHWYDLPDDDVEPESDPVEARTPARRLAIWRTAR